MLAFPKEMLEQDSSYDQIRIVITTKDNENITLSQDDIWTGSLTRSTATSYDSEFTLGAAVTGKLSFIINNIYGVYDKYDFNGSTVIAYLSGEYMNEDGVYVTSDEVCLGHYIIDDYQYDGSTISISGLDYMSKLDKVFNPEGCTFPITLKNLVAHCCSVCGITFLQSNSTFSNSDFIVQTAPKSGSLTCHDVISYAAQIAASYARVDPQGRLYFDWYDIDIDDMGLIGYDGGKFDTDGHIGYSSNGNYYYKYKSGDSLNGGSYERRYINYTDNHGVARQRYADGDTADGGAFTERAAYHYFNNLFSLNTSTDEETITGVRVTVTGTYIETHTDSDGYQVSEEKERTEVKTCPTTGYEGHIIEIEENPLIALGQTQDVANRVGNIINGMRFRPLAASVAENPSVEAGDTAVVTDANGASYPVFISNVTYKNEGATTIACDSENSNESTRRRYTVAAKTGRYVEETLERVRTAREIAMEYMYNLIRTSPGLYEYTETASNGAKTYYLVNQRPDLTAGSTEQILRDSNIRWKFTADAVAVSTNYGRTYPTGITATGTAVLNRIYAIGINADYINTGDLIIGGNTAGTGDINGQILIKDASGNTLVTLSKSGISFAGSASTYMTQITQNAITTEYLNARNITAYTFSATTIRGKTLIVGPDSDSSLRATMTNGSLIWNNTSLSVGDQLTISPEGGLKIGPFSINSAFEPYPGEEWGFAVCLFELDYNYPLSFKRNGVDILSNVTIRSGSIYEDGAFVQRTFAYWASDELHVYNNLRCKKDVETRNLYYLGTIQHTSDRRVKKDIEEIDGSLTRSMNPVRYEMKDGDGRKRFGFIAQEVEEVLPTEEYNVVNRQKVHSRIPINPDDDQTYRLNLDYMEIITPVVAAIQDNSRKIERLENKIKELRGLLQKMKGA